MPIRINLLAEEQAAEELRRRDPVKKVAVGAGAVGALFVIWAILSIVRVMGAGGQLEKLTAQHEGIAEQEKAVNDQKKEIDEIEDKLEALHDLAVERFVWASVLNALQHCVVDGIKFDRITTSQKYFEKAEVRPRRGEGKYEPAESTEQIAFTVYATDTKDAYSRFIDALAKDEFLKSNLGEKGSVKLVERTAPQTDLDNPGVTFRKIVIRCVFPDKLRK